MLDDNDDDGQLGGGEDDDGGAAPRGADRAGRDARLVRRRSGVGSRDALWITVSSSGASDVRVAPPAVTSCVAPSGASIATAPARASVPRTAASPPPGAGSCS